MNYILLTIVTICCSLQMIFKKAYNVKKAGGIFAFSAASAFIAMLFFVISSKGVFKISIDVLPYSIAFAMSYSLSAASSMIAIKIGPLSISSLIVSYSLVLPTIYGLTVLDEPIKIWLIMGIGLLLASLFFINREKKGEEKKITFKWCIFAFLSFIGNGMTSTVQKAQQVRFDGMYKNEFMIVALLITVSSLVIFAIITDKQNVFSSLKRGFWLYTGCGIANGLVNLMVLILSNKMPASVMFPVISAGGVLMSAIVSVFIYKEILSKYQWAGLMLGILSIILLNI